ncbi:MAG: hypothetical protein CBC13_02370 [Planctomycetia bacterium TMED53]|nr:MAG: hypothetical protein CBC13_02370 [Planctomycetia bacterium TMED53]
MAPLDRWDSTRGILEFDDAEEFAWDSGSRDDHEDDVFPDTVEIQLVLNPARSRALARIVDDIGESDDSIRVDNVAEYARDGELFVRIDSEWIQVGGISGNRLIDCVRGVRGTRAQEHLRGTSVVTGTEFRRTVRIPGYRDSRGPR